VKVDLFVKIPMGVFKAAFSPVFFQSALTVEEMFSQSIFIDKVIGIKKTLFSHLM
jgi:hypothetical protein